MVFKPVRRRDRLASLDRLVITLSPTIFRYGAKLVRAAGLNRGSRVTVLTERETFRVGFEFHRDIGRTDSYRVVWQRRGGEVRLSCGACSAMRSVAREFEWIRRVANRPDVRDRCFEPTFDGKLWIITLGPTFERTADRSGKRIPRDAAGIYRYVRRQTGEVVYIGRGNIRQRLAESGRGAWDFDRIEYSLVPDADEQAHWERHWIEDFRERHGRLPERNRV